jgi:PAS domain S-box-containing protein
MQTVTMEGLETFQFEESFALLKLTLRAAQAGSWAWDLVTGEVFWSEEYHHLVGTSPETCQPSGEIWLRAIHPADRERVDGEMRAAVEVRREIDIELRIVRPDGAVRWVSAKGQTLYDEAGAPRRMVGVTFDITERQLAEAALRESEERFRTAAENMIDCFGIYSAVRDGDGKIADFRIEYVNAAACENNLMQKQDQVGRLLCEILPAHRESGLFDEYCAVVETGEPLIRETVTYEDEYTEDEYTRRRLKRSFDIRAAKLGDGFIAAWRDVTERKRTEQAAQESGERARAQAEELTALMNVLSETDQRKDEFLAMLAHELRNPLAPICNAARVMRRLAPPGSQLQQMLEVIERQTDQLTRLVDDLLDVSRISQGKITLRKEKIDLLTVVGRAVETSRPLIDAGGHRLTVSLPSESPRLEGDLTRLAQVISNLLNNAAKYTEKGGNIWLTAEVLDGEVLLRVKDDGIGIPAVVLPRVFDLFVQADRGLDRAQGGLGIGLTLVKNIVGMHGGAVRALSAGPGQGSEFVVHLPVLAEPAYPARAEATDPLVAGESRKASARRILVVDDNVDSAESMALLLGMEGQDVRTAYDGPGAIEVAGTFQPHVVLLDIGLPGMNGHEVAVHLRERLEMRKTVLIALTGYGQLEDRQRSMDAGFDHHLTKPIDYERLGALIRSLATD